MAVIEQAVDSILNGSAAVTALVGSRIYAGKAAQNATDPCIVYSRISSERDHAMSADTGLASARMQISCFGRHYSEAMDVAEAVRGALQDYSGAAGSVTIQRSFVANERFLGYDESSRTYHVAIEFEIWHRE